MNIVQAAGEAVPFCKTGGLADVVGALTSELSKRKNNLTLILPFYQSIARSGIVPTGMALTVRIGRTEHTVPVWQKKASKNPRILFLESKAFFDRKGLYGETPGSAYSDNDERYIFYCKAVLEVCKVFNLKPDIIHGHDWQAGLIPAYMKHDAAFADCATVFTIHNMAYQGLFPASTFSMTGLPSHEYSPAGFEFYGQVNFLKAGLVYSDALNTVSPTYANEIQNDWNYGYGLEGVINFRRDRFRGITNGIDQKIWDPRVDEHIAANYDEKRLTKKAACKADLQKAAGWKPNAETPVVGFIGRLDTQKGIDIIVQLVPRLAKKKAQAVLLGSGDERYRQQLSALHRDYPDSVYYESAFADVLAHKIYAGADIFLMPSKFEPCGLSQMISMRFGTPPVVTPTGGLVDTVLPGTGFMSRSKSYGDFLEAVFMALNESTKKRAWQERQRRIMKIDHSWSPSAGRYLEMYKDAVRWRKAVHV